MTNANQRKELLLILYTVFSGFKKNLAGARFKDGVNNKIDLYHLWYIATTLPP